MSGFGLASFLWRLGLALLLVFATYNPLQWSYFPMITGGEMSVAVKVLIGLVFLICYGIFLVATWKSMGLGGVIIVIIFLAVLVWATGLVESVQDIKDKGELLQWLGLVILAMVLAIGMSWSGIWRRLTGQVTTDDIGDDTN